MAFTSGPLFGPMVPSVIVSMPIPASRRRPRRVPVARSTRTAAVALVYSTRVLPLPVMMSLPPNPSNPF